MYHKQMTDVTHNSIQKKSAVKTELCYKTNFSFTHMMSILGTCIKNYKYLNRKFFG